MKGEKNKFSDIRAKFLFGFQYVHKQPFSHLLRMELLNLSLEDCISQSPLQLGMAMLWSVKYEQKRMHVMPMGLASRFPKNETSYVSLPLPFPLVGRWKMQVKGCRVILSTLICLAR